MKTDYELLITACSNSSYWYSGKVGQRVPYLGASHGQFTSREDAGYTNVVCIQDAHVVKKIKPKITLKPRVWLDPEKVKPTFREGTFCLETVDEHIYFWFAEEEDPKDILAKILIFTNFAYNKGYEEALKK